MWDYVRQGIGIGAGLGIVLVVVVLGLLVMGAVFMTPLEIAPSGGSLEATPIAEALPP